MKSATGLTGSGSRDWYIQRVSAVVLAAYTVVMFGWILCNSGFGYEQWAGFMLTLPMKIFSLLAVLSLVAHAWIGMWQVFTDYVTTRQMGPSASGLRLVLTSAVIISQCSYTQSGVSRFSGQIDRKRSWAQLTLKKIIQIFKPYHSIQLSLVVVVLVCVLLTNLLKQV